MNTSYKFISDESSNPALDCIDFERGLWKVRCSGEELSGLDCNDQWDHFSYPMTGTLYDGEKLLASIMFNKDDQSLWVTYNNEECDGAEIVATQYFNRFECSESLTLPRITNNWITCQYFLKSDPILPMLNLFRAIQQAVYRGQDEQARLIKDGKRQIGETNWIPGCNGTEVPFNTRCGHKVQWLFNYFTGEHQYYCHDSDLFIEDHQLKQFGLAS